MDALAKILRILKSQNYWYVRILSRIPYERKVQATHLVEGRITRDQNGTGVV